MSAVTRLARPEIAALAPYEPAAWEPGLVRMHANELPWACAQDPSQSGLNRYPEPQPRILRERLAALYQVAPEQVLLGRGSDEGIDLMLRAFCRAGQDAILICPPTFGMYAVAARIQGAAIVSVPLRREPHDALDVPAVLAACPAAVKLVFLCSPNNPTGSLLRQSAVLELAAGLAGRAMLVVDEAYVEFASQPSLAGHLARHPHLVVLRTLSKAYALAGARCGAVLGSPELIALLRRIIPPYALTQLTVETALAALAPTALDSARERIALVKRERARLAQALAQCPRVQRVWPSEANFLLAECGDADAAVAAARRAGLLVRDVRAQPGLGTALRISIGTPQQNDRLLEAWS